MNGKTRGSETNLSIMGIERKWKSRNCGSAVLSTCMYVIGTAEWSPTYRVTVQAYH